MSSPSTPALRVLCKPTGSLQFLPRTQIRHESTARRHRKLNIVQQATSYTPDRAAPSLIFNPPSAAPSVYHTPLKFLPENDTRKRLLTSALAHNTLKSLSQRTSAVTVPGTPLSTASHLPPKPSAALPPPVRAPYEKKYHLEQKDIDEIRRLRKKDPEYWTRWRLAEKFQCSNFFVGMIAKNEGKAARVEQEHMEARNRWGNRRRMAREDRGRRKESWGRDA